MIMFDRRIIASALVTAGSLLLVVEASATEFVAIKIADYHTSRPDDSSIPLLYGARYPVYHNGTIAFNDGGAAIYTWQDGQIAFEDAYSTFFTLHEDRIGFGTAGSGGKIYFESEDGHELIVTGGDIYCWPIDTDYPGFRSETIETVGYQRRAFDVKGETAAIVANTSTSLTHRVATQLFVFRNPNVPVVAVDCPHEHMKDVYPRFIAETFVSTRPDADDSFLTEIHTPIIDGNRVYFTGNGSLYYNTFDSTGLVPDQVRPISPAVFRGKNVAGEAGKVMAHVYNTGISVDEGQVAFYGVMTDDLFSNVPGELGLFLYDSASDQVKALQVQDDSMPGLQDGETFQSPGTLAMHDGNVAFTFDTEFPGGPFERLGVVWDDEVTTVLTPGQRINGLELFDVQLEEGAVGDDGFVAGLRLGPFMREAVYLFKPTEQVEPGTSVATQVPAGPAGQGVTIEFDQVTQSGAFSGEYSPTDYENLTDELRDSIDFLIPTDPVQLWDLNFSGEFEGNARLVFTYDDSDLISDESVLQIYHQLSDGAWEVLPKLDQDIDANTITVETGSFSPFIVGSVSEPLIGDADGDGDVDAFDLGIWQTQFGTFGEDLSADFDDDGDVDAFDLGLWQTNFGTGVDDSGVPEPSSVVLLGVAGIGLLIRRHLRPFAPHLPRP